MCNPAKQPVVMSNPYESYIQMLLPLLMSANCAGENSTEALSFPTKVTVSICDDNARSLCDDASMTMKLLKPKVSAVNRWSSVPDLQGFGLSMSSKNKSSNSRSIDDLRSLMTNNSKAPRSTDNLRGALSTGSLARVRRQVCNGTASPQGNDRWESKGPKKNPFDLRMPGLGLSTTGTSFTPNNSLPPRSTTTPPRRKTNAQSGMKIPERRVSMEAVRRDAEPGCPHRGERPSSRVTEESPDRKEATATPQPQLIDLAPQPVIRAS